MPERRRRKRPLAPVALALAWIVPGAGHLYLRRPVRAAIIFVTISATFWAGVAMGGVMTIDRDNEPWWFAADMLTGVHGLVSWGRQQRQYERIVAAGRPPLPAPGDRLRPDPVAVDQEVQKLLAAHDLALVPPVDTAARAYAGVAGLINLLCVFDAAILAAMGVTGEPPRPRPPDRKPSP